MDKNKFEVEFRNNEHWDASYERLMLKKLTQEEKDELWKLSNIYKEDIISQIMNGTYTWSIPRKLKIAKHESTKKRIVYMYSVKDRFVQGVLYRTLSAYFKDSLSNNCFSYKRDVSTSSAIDYIKDNRTKELSYGVKTDIHAYFNSVCREKVESAIDEITEGCEGLNKTLKNLMLNDTVLWEGKEIQEWKSLIPGSPLGSFFANWCLKELDREFDKAGKVYARYSDDIIVLEDSEDKLKDDIKIIQRYIADLGLELNPDKYKWFKSGEDIDFLGLRLNDNGVIDISDHAKQKMKKQIHRWCRKGRMEIERDGKEFKDVARRINRRLNRKNFKCYIDNEATFGWCAYAFPRITTVESLRELDLYTKERLRALKTGKNNKANYRKMQEDEFKDIGWVSLVQLYYLFKKDFDYYCEVIELL